MDAWAPDLRRASTEYLLLVPVDMHSCPWLCSAAPASLWWTEFRQGRSQPASPVSGTSRAAPIGFDWPCPVATIPHDQQEGHTV